jgi:UDP-N-acetylmuramate dehydrogenase
VRYAELERALASEPRTLGSVRDRVIALRRAKSMVIDPGDPSSRSAGSFFTNPVVERTAADGVAERARAAGVLGAGETMPSWPAGSDRVKLAAAWLIERAGFTRGTRRGRAGISERHSLALVNYGGAGALEVVALAREIRDGVEERFGVRLVPEPELVGFAAGEVGDLAT